MKTCLRKKSSFCKIESPLLMRLGNQYTMRKVGSSMRTLHI
jgi:hypothetical protein